MSTSPPDHRRLLRGAVLFAALGLFWATENPWHSAFVGRPLGSPFGRVLFYWTVHWMVWGVFALGVARLVRRFPPGRARPGRFLLHAGAAVVVGLAQMLVMRSVIFTILLALGENTSFGESFTRDVQSFAHKNLLTYIAIVAATLGLDAARRARDQELRTARLAEQLAQAELAALRMQLHPHFLFNSLHTAAELVHENPAAAERSLLGLADLLRRALRAAEKADVPLAEELEFVDGYLALESARLDGRLAVDYRVPEELLTTRVPSLVLQPVVENAVRHGVSRRPAGGRIVVAATAAAGELELTVENDAPGPDEVPPRPGAGIGLANVRARLGQRFGDAGRVEAGRVAPERFRTRLVMPLEPSAPEPAALAAAAAGERA